MIKILLIQLLHFSPVLIEPIIIDPYLWKKYPKLEKKISNSLRVIFIVIIAIIVSLIDDNYVLMSALLTIAYFGCAFNYVLNLHRKYIRNERRIGFFHLGNNFTDLLYKKVPDLLRLTLQVFILSYMIIGYLYLNSSIAYKPIIFHLIEPFK